MKRTIFMLLIVSLLCMTTVAAEVRPIPDMRVSLVIQELGVWQHCTLTHTDLKSVVRDSLPYLVEQAKLNGPPGDYWVRIVISNDHMKVVKYRVLTVV